MHNTVSGTYYRRVSYGRCLYYIGSQIFLAFDNSLGVEIYKKATFNNGVKTINGIVAISGFASVLSIPVDSNPGKVNINTDRRQWCSIEKQDRDNIFNMYQLQGFGGPDKFGQLDYTNVDKKNITYGNGTVHGIYILKPASSESVNLIGKISTWMNQFTEDGSFHPEITTNNYNV